MASWGLGGCLRCQPNRRYAARPMGTHYDEDLLGRRLLATLAAIGATDDDDEEEEEEEEEEETQEKPKRGDSEDVKRLRAESKKRRLALRDERKAREEAEAKLKALEDKDKTDLEKSTTELDGLKAEIAKMKPAYEQAQRELAFFKSGVANQFQNPAHALRLIDLADLDLADADPDEVASALKEKATALLKESPYLKAAAGGSDGEGEGESGEGGETPPNTTGAGASRGKPGKNQPPNNAALVKRFPALAGRIDVGSQQQS